MSRNKKRELIFTAAAVLIIIAAFSLRIYSPRSDLPPDISISGSIYTDEGNQCHNSRSKALYGEWFPDNWKITNYNPVVPYLKLMIFKGFGVGLVQVRSVTFLFALLSLIFFYLTVRSYFDRWLSLAGIALLGFNFLFIMYNRIGTFETPMIFWMILAVFFIEKYRVTGKMIYPVLSGISAFMAFVFKMTGAHMIPVPVTALILALIFVPEEKLGERKKTAAAAGWMIAAVAVSFAFWMLVFYLPNREWIKSAPGSYIGNQMFPKSMEQALGNILAYNWKEQFYKMWVVWAGAILYLPVFFRRLLDKRSDITESGAVLFLLSHTSALMIMNHRPTRYLIAAIPPMVLLTLLLFRYFLAPKRESVSRGMPKKFSILIADVLWLGLSLYYCFLPLMERIGIRPLPVELSPRLFLVSLGAVLFFRFSVYLIRRLRNGDLCFPRFAAFAVSMLMMVSLFINMKYYHYWNRDRTQYVYDIAEDLDRKIEEGHIAGLTAPVAVLESNHRSLFLYPDFVHWGKDTLDRYAVTHALLANFNFEISNFFGQWPEKMKNALLLNAYNVKDQFLHLYSMSDPVITRAERIDDENLELSVLNNGRDRAIRVGIMEFDQNVPSEERILPGEFKVNRGINTLRIEAHFTGNEKLVYIQKKNWPRNFRYEAEKFPRKRGRVIREPRASGRHLRFFNSSTDREGFMACSINGRFIPWAEGYMNAGFFLRFDRFKSRIRPLAVIDIFNNTLGSPVSSKALKKRDISGEGFRKYSLHYKIREVSDIEFRVMAKKTADIYYDYLELEYVQGKFVDGN